VFLVSSESKEIAAFDFTDAILNGRPDDAFSILGELKLRKEKPEILLSSMARVICDLLTVKVLTDSGLTASTIASRLSWHEYKVGLYVKSASRCSTAILHRLAERCYEADLLIKSTKVDSYTVLDRLAAETAVR
jgi:DNA polymerase III delta subunit